MTPEIQLVVFALRLWAVLYLAQSSLIFSPFRLLFITYSGLPRWVLEAFYCPSCAGAWVALGMWRLGAPPWAHALWYDAMLAGVALGAIWGLYGPETAWHVELKGTYDDPEEQRQRPGDEHG